LQVTSSMNALVCTNVLLYDVVLVRGSPLYKGPLILVCVYDTKRSTVEYFTARSAQ